MARDEAAWNEFVRVFSPVIKRTALRVVERNGPGQGVSAEDLVQTTFLRLLRDDCRLLRIFDPDRAGLATYISQVAASTALNVLNRKVVPTVPLEEHSSLAVPAEMAIDPAGIPLEALSSRERQVVQMVLSEDLSNSEISARLGISRNCVSTYKYSAIKTLRRLFPVFRSRR